MPMIVINFCIRKPVVLMTSRSLYDLGDVIADATRMLRFTRKLAKMLICFSFSANDPCVSHEAILGERERSYVLFS